MAASSSSHISDRSETTTGSSPVISSSLKFVLSNLKNIVQNPLSPDNYPLWRSQIFKICRANNFDTFLDPNSSIPHQSITQTDGTITPNSSYAQWLLTDQNLAAAICSTISASILPYVLHLDSTSAIWQTLETRFQSSCRSKVIQLKNELYRISLKNSTMAQYLNEVKLLVDQIEAAGYHVDFEDIILHILNGLPPAYQSFKTTIRTMTTPMSLD
ncbi:hypothetical protein KFK09_022521 [Dendrobium nobile]|uniref:Retrovirus-related Pol polyprotein from transposon TNT 1-94 n=1 Tax=Dendrobium nobile TaxID=94219 RepID=A0A8T3AK98_DENNO|nr:hypothetical protein KFK09_022521 [Dendrobium nobile]